MIVAQWSICPGVLLFLNCPCNRPSPQLSPLNQIVTQLVIDTTVCYRRSQSWNTLSCEDGLWDILMYITTWDQKQFYGKLVWVWIYVSEVGLVLSFYGPWFGNSGGFYHFQSTRCYVAPYRLFSQSKWCCVPLYCLYCQSRRCYVALYCLHS